MIAWRGAGFVVLILAMFAFLGVGLGFDGPAKGTLWPWGMAAAAVGVLVLPLGLVLNRRRRDNTHDLMFIPMQYWGALLLVGGLGAMGGHLFLADEGESAATACEDLGTAMSACGPAAAMLTSSCAAGPPEAQQACLDCVQAQPDPCNPALCGTVCSFGH